MAMEKFLTSLVFCEAPLDGYGTSVLSAHRRRDQGIKQLVSGGATKPGPLKEDVEKEQGMSNKSMLQRRAGFELAFDCLNCFDSVVMH